MSDLAATNCGCSNDNGCGCNGNLKAIPKLVQGLTVEQVEEKLSGISCSGRPTSCGDQLAKACRAALEAQNA